MIRAIKKRHRTGRMRAALLALLMLGISGCASLPVPAPIDEEAVYIQRYKAQDEAAKVGGGLPIYEPLEKVAGAQLIQHLQSAMPVVANAALQEARNYAAARDSSAFMVWHKGALIEETYFDGFNRDALINAKSLAKPLTAILIGRAIAQGYIKSLDQPVADFITEWKNDPRRSKILIRHLLDMRTGLLAQGIATGPDDILLRAYLHPRHDEIIINEYPLINEPGTRYDYSNANSELVAPLIERATGMRYAQYLTHALLEPIGAAGGTIFVNRPGGTAHSGCCVQLPAQTWLKLGILLLKDGVWNGRRLLPAGHVTAMRTPTRENPNAGLGVWTGEPYAQWRGSLNPEFPMGRTLHSEHYAVSDLFLFDGNGSQVVYIVPSQDLVILRTGNYPPKALPWDNSIVPNLVIRGMTGPANKLVPIGLAPASAPTGG